MADFHETCYLLKERSTREDLHGEGKKDGKEKNGC